MLIPLYDRNPHTRFPWVTVLLIAANVLCFWRSIEGGEAAYTETVFERGFIPQRLTRVGEEAPVVIQQDLNAPDGRALRLTARLSTAPQDVYPTLLTMMFLHGGWFHLITNLWMLWVFGDNIEYRLGRFVYLTYYLVGGLLASLTQWVADPMATTPVIGASGAVATVLGGYLVTYPSAKVRTLLFLGFPLLLDLPSYLVLGAWFLLQVLAGLQSLGAPADVQVAVAFWAHVGGFVAGVLLLPLLAVGSSPPGEDWRAESKQLFEFWER